MTVQPWSPRRRARRRAGPALLAAALLAAALAVQRASAQDARALAMGGVTVAGPAAAGVNPAFAAVPGGRHGSLTLPLGALSALTHDYWNPSSSGFDALSTLDQASALELYLLDPAVSPDRVTLGVGANGLRVTFQDGSRLRLAAPSAFDAELGLPLGGSVGPLRLAVRPFATLHTRFAPGQDLQRVFGSGSTSASATFSADAVAGVALDLGAAVPLPVPPAALGGARLFVGARASGIAGLAKAGVFVQGQARAEQDSSGAYTGKVDYSYDGTVSEGGLLNGTVGYGAETALGLAVTAPASAGRITAGVSVRHLGVMVWTVRRTQIQGNQSGSSSRDLGTAREVDLARHVDVAADVALDVPAGRLGVAGMGLTVAADGNVDLTGGFALHAGAEARFGPLALRAGAGYQDGLRLGVGAGLRTGPVGFDVALASHRSPLTDHQAYGIAASLAFGR